MSAAPHHRTSTTPDAPRSASRRPESPKRSSLAPAALAVVAAVAFATAAAARQESALPFDASWRLTDEASVETHDGRRTLRLGNGRAAFEEAGFLDGTIDLDVKLTGVRSFISVELRVESPDEYEDFYVRPHKSNLPDALQYSPVFRGESNWQLFHGPGGAVAAPLPAGSWVHLRVVLQGSKAAFFVGDASEPQLLIHRLAHQPRRGGIALRGFVPGGVEGTSAARIADVRISPAVDYVFPPQRVAETPSGLLTRWSISPPVVQPDEAVLAVPAAIAKGPWRTVEAEPNGTVILGRHVARHPDETRADGSTLLARLSLRAATDTVQRIDLGWSDAITVFVNGAPLFSRSDAYSFDQPRREGLIGLDQGTLFLPLRRGENEVLLAITEFFGGWGLIGRLDPAAGVELLPP